MPEQAQTGFFSRINNWFKRGGSSSGDNAMLTGEGLASDADRGSIDEQPHASASNVQPVVARSTFLRPWAKRDAAIENLQNGVVALGDLMNSIRDNLERTSNRQDELLQYLSHLPGALQQLPEHNRVQGEALRAIQKRMEQQEGEQSKLASLLERMAQADQTHGRTLAALNDRVESLGEQDRRIADNLGDVGEALQSVTRSSEATSAVLQRMHENLDTRDSELERILHRQGTRFTTMLAIAIFLSVGALVSVCVMGYLMMNAR